MICFANNTSKYFVTISSRGGINIYVFSKSKHCVKFVLRKRLQELVITFIIARVITIAMMHLSQFIFCMTNVFLSLKMKSRIKLYWNNDTNASIPSRISVFFSSQIGCCNYRGERRKVQMIKLHVSCKPENTARRSGRPAVSISLRREFECHFTMTILTSVARRLRA